CCVAAAWCVLLQLCNDSSDSASGSSMPGGNRLIFVATVASVLHSIDFRLICDLKPGNQIAKDSDSGLFSVHGLLLSYPQLQGILGGYSHGRKNLCSLRLQTG